MIKAPTLLLKYALASFIIGLGIYFGCLALNDVGAQKPGKSYRAIFIVYIVTSFLGLLIYYVPSILKELELSPARRQAQIMTRRPAKLDREEKGILRNIDQLLSSEARQIREEDGSDEEVDRPQAHELPVEP